MPVDPQLLNALANPKMPQFDNPMEQMGAHLKNAMMMGEMQKDHQAQATRSAMNAMAREYVRPDGTFNRPGMVYGMAQGDLGSEIQGTQEGWKKLDKYDSEIGDNDAKIQKTKAEALQKEMEIARSFLRGVSKDPHVGARQLFEQFTRDKQNPIITGYIKERGGNPEELYMATLDKLNAALAQEKTNPGSYEQFLMSLQLDPKDASATHQMLVSETGGQKIVSMNTHGNANPQVVGQYGPAPRAPGTNVTVNNAAPQAEKEFGRNLGKIRSDNFGALEQANNAALKAAPEVDHMLKLLDDGVTAGALSSQITDARALAKTLGFKVNEKQLVNTQMLRQGLIGNVFNTIAQLKAKGVSLTPMTDHDVALLKDYVTKGTDDIETIRQSLLRYRQMLQDINADYHAQARRYNESAVGPALRALPTGDGGLIPGIPPGVGDGHGVADELGF